MLNARQPMVTIQDSDGISDLSSFVPERIHRIGSGGLDGLIADR